MSLYQRFFDRFILPLFKPVVIARSLAKKQPKEACEILKNISAEKTISILGHWSIGVRTVILNELGESVIRLLGLMSYEDRAKMLIALSPKIVKTYSKEITSQDLQGMLQYWSDAELKLSMQRFTPDTSAKLVTMLDDNVIVTVLRDLKPWIQASLAENLPLESKAALIENLEFSAAIELFYRWHSQTQAKLVTKLSLGRQQELFRVLAPKNIATIMSHWDINSSRELLLNLEDDRIRDTYILLDSEIQYDLFPELPEYMQIRILNNVETATAVMLLEGIPKETADSLVEQTSEDTAAGIRMANLMR